MEKIKVESILALDVGTAFAKAALFDVVEGQLRFIARGQAPSTIFPPDADVAEGIFSAVRSVEEIVGRRLLGPQGFIVPEANNGHGVDACFIVSSVGSLLRTMIVGTSVARTASLLSEVGAMPSVNVVGTVSLDAKLPVGQSRMGQLLAALNGQQPQVLIVGDGDSSKTGLVELAQTLAISAQTSGVAPAVVFLGDEAGADAFQRALRDGGSLQCMTGSAPPSTGYTPLQQRLKTLWQGVSPLGTSRSNGLDALSERPPMPAQDGFANALRFLAAHRSCNVWGVDLGAGTSIGFAVVDGVLSTSIRPGLGMGQGSLALLGEAQSVDQWLPLPFSPAERSISDRLVDKYLHTCAVPETEEELAGELALGREMARQVLSDLPKQPATARASTLLIGRGAVLGEAPGIGQGTLFLLDAFQPVGLVELAIDRFGILPMLGAIAEHLPEAAAELMLRDGLLRLGPCIGIGGQAKDEAVVAKIVCERSKQKTNSQVVFGGIMRLPIDDGETVKLAITPVGKMDCGAGPGRKLSITVQGGPLGLVIDARGRPLEPAKLGEKRVRFLAAWREALRA